MTDTLRDKLIQKGWVTPFNAATLVRLIEEHYADEPAVPAPPADGEVADLVAWLQEEADDYECIGCEDSAAKCNRAAELLQRPMADLSPTAYELLTLAAELES